MAHPSYPIASTAQRDPEDRQRDRVVLLSGGLASFEAARRTIAKYGGHRVRLWFFDTRIEDADLYRFLDDVEQSVGIPVERFADGRNPWQVFREERFIGNSRADVCSKHLKRRLLERLLRGQYRVAPALVFGLDWTEPHRVETVEASWAAKGYRTEFPLTAPPLMLHDDYVRQLNSMGIHIPRLYTLGFPHNNCGGACIKAGIKQWAHLLDTFPERYLWHEANEQAMRKYLSRDISILRNRNGGKTRPMTLRFLRWRLRQGKDGHMPELLMPMDGWACGCFSEFPKPASEAKGALNAR